MAAAMNQTKDPAGAVKPAVNVATAADSVMVALLNAACSADGRVFGRHIHCRIAEPAAITAAACQPNVPAAKSIGTETGLIAPVTPGMRTLNVAASRARAATTRKGAGVTECQETAAVITTPAPTKATIAAKTKACFGIVGTPVNSLTDLFSPNQRGGRWHAGTPDQTCA